MNLKHRIGVLNDTAIQKDAYLKGRAHVKRETGSEKNACAATCCVYHGLMGVSIGLHLNTDQVRRALFNIGYELVGKQPDWELIEPGDVLFAEDVNNNGMPDHVCIAVGKPDAQGHCLVLDNYYDHPHSRNMLTGTRTPLDFYLSLRDK